MIALRRLALAAVTSSLVGAGCSLDPIDEPEFEADGPPGTILITTTDHATGSISVFDVHTRTISADVALGARDTIPFFHDGLAYFVHRFMIDRIDVRDPEEDWALLAQHPLDTESGKSANAQGLCFDEAGRAWVTQYGEASLRILALDAQPGQAELGTLDLLPWADGDGLLEARVCHSEESRILVFAERLDQDSPNWPKVDADLVLAIDSETRSVETEAELLGRWAKQVRRPHATDDLADGDTVYVLTTGIVALDPETLAMEWVVDESAFAAAGIDDPEVGHQLPQSFDVAARGEFYVAAYTPEFDQVRLYRARKGEVPKVVIEDGLNAVDRTLEVFENELWFGDTTLGRSGMRGYDLSVDPPEALSDSAVSTGLPPYSMRAIPFGN